MGCASRLVPTCSNKQFVFATDRLFFQQAPNGPATALAVSNLAVHLAGANDPSTFLQLQMAEDFVVVSPRVEYVNELGPFSRWADLVNYTSPDF